MNKKERDRQRDQEIREEIEEFLRMFKHLGQSYEAMADKSGIKAEFLRIDGFDGHRETQYLRVGERMDDGINDSHMPRLDGYRKMVRRWEGRKKEKELLTREDIVFITDS